MRNIVCVGCVSWCGELAVRSAADCALVPSVRLVYSRHGDAGGSLCLICYEFYCVHTRFGVATACMWLLLLLVCRTSAQTAAHFVFLPYVCVVCLVEVAGVGVGLRRVENCQYNRHDCMCVCARVAVLLPSIWW